MSKDNVTASFRFRGEDITSVPVVNPGDWWGRTWLIEVGCGYSSLFFIVEADYPSDAVEEFSESEWGHLIHIEEPDLADYPEDDLSYDADGNPYTLENVMYYGTESYRYSDRPPFPVRYFGRYSGHDLPAKGIKPSNLDSFIRWKDEMKAAQSAG
jgi:hypothetical protein